MESSIPYLSGHSSRPACARGLLPARLQYGFSAHFLFYDKPSCLRSLNMVFKALGLSLSLHINSLALRVYFDDILIVGRM